MSFVEMNRRSGSLDVLRKHFDEELRPRHGYKLTFDQLIKQESSGCKVATEHPQWVYSTASIEEAFDKCSSIARTDKIKNTPVCIIKSKNDPLLGHRDSDDLKVLQNPNFLLART